jgi:cbb3-type cytochrome oxidase subunit 3
LILHRSPAENNERQPRQGSKVVKKAVVSSNQVSILCYIYLCILCYIQIIFHASGKTRGDEASVDRSDDENASASTDDSGDGNDVDLISNIAADDMYVCIGADVLWDQ